MRGSSASGTPGGWCRRGPPIGSGDAKHENIGSVRMFTPPTCSSTVEWPIQVAAGVSRLAVRKARSGAMPRTGDRGGRGRRLTVRVANHRSACQPLTSSPDALR